MGWGNPPVPWSELERILSGRPRPGLEQDRRDPSRPRDGRTPHEELYPGDGGDSPAWSRRRQSYVPPAAAAGALERTVPFAELHAHSAFSFLDGASQPEELVEEAARLGLEALALTDHDGMHGVVRFAEAAREVGMPTVFGSELSLGLPGPQNGVPDPAGSHLLVLARGPEGYRRLSRAIAAAHLEGGEKGKPVYDLDALTAAAGGHWQVLTGCRKGAVRQALVAGGPRAASGALGELVDRFGADRVAVELTDHGLPDDDERNDVLAALAGEHHLEVVATTGAHFAVPERFPLASALAAVRARRSLDEAAGWLPPAAGAHLRSGAELTRRFAGHPCAVPVAAELGRECAFDLALVAPNLPPWKVPAGYTEDTWLRELTMRGAARRYGPPAGNPAAYAQIDRELAVISALTFPGYFLVVHDIVTFCHENDILCQGRGSAANSAVCFALGITPVDAVANGAALRALPLPGARRPARHRRRHRVRPPRGGHPARLPEVRPRPTPPRWPTSSPTAAARRCATWRVRWGSRRGSRMRGASSWTGGGRCVTRTPPSWRPATTTCPPRCSSSRPRSRTSPATSASTPAAW